VFDKRVATIETPNPGSEELPFDPDGPTALRWSQWGTLGIPVALLAVLAWTHRSMFDDGYIYLHVVQNILAGNGPVFNQGQRVEVFTGPLWTAILALVGLLTPFPLEWIAVVLGIVMTLAGTILAIAGSSRFSRMASPGAFLLPLGAVVFVATYPVWSYASMGLETGLTFLWIGACLGILVRWAATPDQRLGRLTIMVLGLGPLVRPELVLDTLVFVGVVLAVEWSKWTWRDRLRLVCWTVAIPAIYQVFRMGYYGEIVANTAIAKEATMPRPGRGFEYLLDFGKPYWLLIPVLSLVAGVYVPMALALRQGVEGSKRFWAFLALPLAGFLNGVYITMMGGDYVHARLLMPTLFSFCAPVAASPMTRRYALSFLVLPWAVVATTTLRPPAAEFSGKLPFIFVPGSGQVTPVAQGWGPSGIYNRWYFGPGVYVQFGFLATSTRRLDSAPAPETHLPTVAVGSIGVESYALGTDVQILDFLGLADPLTAHLELTKRGHLSGHEKPLPTSWLGARLTAVGSSTSELDALQHGRLDQFVTPLTPPAYGRELMIQTSWARAALSCPLIRRITYGQNAPMTAGGLVSNFMYAFGNSQVRIPPDPEAAYHRFCGSGVPDVVARALRS